MKDEDEDNIYLKLTEQLDTLLSSDIWSEKFPTSDDDTVAVRFSTCHVQGYNYMSMLTLSMFKSRQSAQFTTTHIHI